MKMLLDGSWLDREEKMAVQDPQDNAVIDIVPQANAADMRAAIDAAVCGAERAQAMPAHERISILRETAQAVATRHEEFARTIAREGVKTIREARKEVTRCIETLRISAEEARRVGGETIPFDQHAGSENRVGYFLREPLGIIGALTPFNDPLNLVAHKIGPALAAGNAIIVKPHEETPLSALKLAEIFMDAGLPRGVLQVITGYGAEVGDVLVTDPRVRMISFTGGRATGEAILKKAGLKKVSMELGSNSPVIVMPDADLELAVEANVSGAFWAAGQNCLHVQRLFVHEKIFGEFALRFVERAEKYRVGNKLDETTDMGPLINAAAAARVERLVEEAVAKGARVLTGGGNAFAPILEKSSNVGTTALERSGNFYAPTVLQNVPDTCALARKEIFGPVTLLYRFGNFDEAIARANNVEYGLQAGIFTRDLQTAFRAVKRLQCGGVMVNDSSDYRIDAMPFGGVKGSGIGREGIRFALQEMTEPKVVCFNL